MRARGNSQTVDAVVARAGDGATAKASATTRTSHRRFVQTCCARCADTKIVVSRVIASDVRVRLSLSFSVSLVPQFGPFCSLLQVSPSLSYYFSRARFSCSVHASRETAANRASLYAVQLNLLSLLPGPCDFSPLCVHSLASTFREAFARFAATAQHCLRDGQNRSSLLMWLQNATTVAAPCHADAYIHASLTRCQHCSMYEKVFRPRRLRSLGLASFDRRRASSSSRTRRTLSAGSRRRMR
eukprot:1002962-Pleurochrysis_carterae.AAC.2